METRRLDQLAVYPERTALARVVSLNETRLSAEISAPIARMHAEVGQSVRKGALVAELDCRDHELASERARAALQSAEARARLADMQAERASRLANEHFISGELLDTRKAERDAARAEVAVLRADVRTAEHQQGKCRLHAPFAAVVLERTGQTGEMAAPGTPLVTLLDVNRLELKADIQESDAVDLERSGRLVFSADGGQYPVRLIRQSPALNPGSRLLDARLRFLGSPARPGSSGTLSWKTRVAHVPAGFIVRRNGQLGVYVLEGNTPRFTPLPGAQEGRPAMTDLPPETAIVVKGQQTLR